MQDLKAEVLRTQLEAKSSAQDEREVRSPCAHRSGKVQELSDRLSLREELERLESLAALEVALCPHELHRLQS